MQNSICSPLTLANTYVKPTMCGAADTVEHRAGSSAITRLAQRAAAGPSEALQIDFNLYLSYGAAPCQGMGYRVLSGQSHCLLPSGMQA